MSTHAPGSFVGVLHEYGVDSETRRKLSMAKRINFKGCVFYDSSSRAEANGVRHSALNLVFSTLVSLWTFLHTSFRL